jgi:hypothetical protein
MVGLVALQPTERSNTTSAEWLLVPIDSLSTVAGISTMAEFMVALDRITYCAV